MSNDNTTCRRCGQIGGHDIEPGTKVHHAALRCGGCRAFLRWLPKPGGQRWPKDPSEWTYRHPARVAMRGKPATEKQLDIIRNSDTVWKWIEPVNRDEAFLIVSRILGGEGAK